MGWGKLPMRVLAGTGIKMTTQCTGRAVLPGKGMMGDYRGGVADSAWYAVFKTPASVKVWCLCLG